jgi:O-antigen ligase/tetratricopeptide (TPR) repeat protein
MRHPLQAPVGRPLPLHATIARSLLLLHLTLSPLFICQTTREVFEEPKALLLTLTALTLAGIALSAWALRPGCLFPLVRSWLRDPVCLGFLLLTASASVSTLGSISPLVSWRGAPDSHFGLTTMLGYLALFLATRILCRVVPQGQRLLAAVTVAVPMVAVYALAQVTGRDPLTWAEAAVFAGRVRPGSTLGHPNYLGAYLATALPLLIAGAVQAGRAGRWLYLAFLALVGFVAAGVTALTLSRAAWLAGGVSVLVLLIGAGWSLRRGGAVVLAAVVLLLGGVGVLGLRGPWLSAEMQHALSERVRRLGDGEGRWHIWQAAWGLFRDRPVLGCGPDTFALGFGAHRPPDYHEVEPDTTPARAHNEALHILATQGVLGGLSLLVLVFGLTRAAWAAWRTQAPDDRPLVLAAGAGVLAFLVQGLFGFTVIGCGTLFVTLAALLSAWSEPATTGPRGPQDWGWFAPGVVASGGLSILVFALNVGACAWPVILVFAVAGVLGALAALRAGPYAPVPRPAAEPAPRPSPGWRRYPLQVGIGAATAAAVVVGVVRPYQGSVCSRAGEWLVQTAPEQAVASYQQALAHDPDSDADCVRLGAVAVLAGRQAPTPAGQQHYFELARRAFERAVALVPAAPYHHANLARALGELASRGLATAANANREWDAALEADPDNPRFLAEAARTALAVGEPARARRLATRGLDAHPRFALLRTQLGNCAFAEGRLPEALPLLCEAVELDWGDDQEGKTRVLATIAAVYLALGQPAAAQGFARQATERWPNWPTARLLLAQALERCGERAGACAEYRRLLGLVPDHAEARAAMRRLESSSPSADGGVTRLNRP